MREMFIYCLMYDIVLRDSRLAVTLTIICIGTDLSCCTLRSRVLVIEIRHVTELYYL